MMRHDWNDPQSPKNLRAYQWCRQKRLLPPADLAAVPDALPAPPPSAANAQPEVIAIVVAKRTVEIFMSLVSKLLVGG